MKRGEIYYADLSPVVGSEQGGTRPVLIIQNDTGNQHAPTTIVAPLTCRKKKLLPTHVNIWQKGLRDDSVVMCEQIRTIDKSRLQDYIGSVDEQTMQNINQALFVSIGLLHTGEQNGKETNGQSQWKTQKRN